MGAPLSRRRVLSLLGMTAGAAAMWKTGRFRHVRPPDSVSVSRFVMGTIVNVTLCGENGSEDQTVASDLFDEILRLENVFSRHRPDSDLARLNAVGVLHRPNPALVEVLTLARRVSDASKGAFDVTVLPLLVEYERHRAARHLPPAADVDRARAAVGYGMLHASAERIAFDRAGMAVTLDGIAKGYVVDRGVALLKTRGYDSVLVEAGGDLFAAGTAEAGHPWQIGVQSPRGPAGEASTRVAAANRGVATSGDYMQAYSADRRHHHIIDPRTGYSPPELAGATVIAPSAAVADALATAVMVLGAERGLTLVKGWQGAEALVVRKDGQTAGVTSCLPADPHEPDADASLKANPTAGALDEPQ